jgi:hypothetical protein
MVGMGDTNRYNKAESLVFGTMGCFGKIRMEHLYRLVEPFPQGGALTVVVAKT